MISTSNDLIQDVAAYCEGENLVGTLANVSALIMSQFADINWVGFYLYDQERLVLGPFQGKPACTKIELGRGVCGRAAKEQKTYCVDDVLNFSDHISCDSASRSEVVVPMIWQGHLVGVLDVDSPTLKRFTPGDVKLFESIVSVLMSQLKFRRG